MVSLPQLFSRAWHLIRKHPTPLILPPLAANFLIAFVFEQSFELGPIILAGLINLAILAGWLTLIARAGSEAEGTMDDFFTSIGRHFWQLAIGMFNFFSALFFLLLPLLFLTWSWIGDDALNHLNQALIPVTTGKVDPALLFARLDPAAVTTLEKLAVVGCAGLAVYGLLTFLLTFWTQSVVINHHAWNAAWKESMGIVRGHLGKLFGLATIQGIVQVIAMSLAFIAPISPILGSVGAALLILASRVYFTVVYTLFFIEENPIKTTDETKLTQPAHPV